jgi:hypothetical protein
MITIFFTEFSEKNGCGMRSQLSSDFNIAGYEVSRVEKKKIFSCI